MKHFFKKPLMVTCFTLVGVGIWAQTSTTPQPSPLPKKTIFGLPVAKPDNGAKESPAPKGADSLEDRSLPSSFREMSEGDLRTNWAAAARVFVAIEGSIQGKFKSTPQGGEDLGFECLSYALPPQLGNGQKSTIRITIAKESDGATSELFRALSTREPLKTVTLKFFAKGGKELHKATLTDASIVGIQQTTDAKTRRILEDITLNFIKIVMN